MCFMLCLAFTVNRDAELGNKRQSEAAAHSERSFIKTCFPGLGWFLLSRQHYRHSEETFSTAMCKTAYERKTGTFSFTVGFQCDWPALSQRRRHFVFYIFSFFKLFQTHKQTTTSSVHCIDFQHWKEEKKWKPSTYTTTGKRPELYFKPSVGQLYLLSSAGCSNQPTPGVDLLTPADTDVNSHPSALGRWAFLLNIYLFNFQKKANWKLFFFFF